MLLFSSKTVTDGRHGAERLPRGHAANERIYAKLQPRKVYPSLMDLEFPAGGGDALRYIDIAPRSYPTLACPPVMVVVVGPHPPLPPSPSI